MLNVLIGCEESGVVRDAFAKRGHNAFSNDLVSARNGGQHLQMDVMDALDYMPWDIVILHPECTKVCNAGNRHYAGTVEREEAVEWIVALWKKAKRVARRGVALENPASVIWPALRPMASTVQFVQPYEFGHMEQKKTGLALYRLPPLKPTNDVWHDMMQLPVQERQRMFHMVPGPNRTRDRSETYSGIADAMAVQWPNYRSAWELNR